MIHYKIEDGQILEMDVRGSLKENLADVAMLANGIYSMLAKSRPDVAEVFRLALSAAMQSTEESDVYQERLDRATRSYIGDNQFYPFAERYPEIKQLGYGPRRTK